MKIKLLQYSIFFIITLILFYGCVNKRNTNSIAIEMCGSDNEVINHTIQSIVDSIDNQIKMDLGKDYLKYKVIYVGDSLRDFGEYTVLYRKAGVIIDSIDCNRKNKSKLEVLNKALGGGKELKLVSSYKEYSELVSRDSVNRVLLAFSRVHFNKKCDEGVLTIMFSSSYNTGINYAAYVKKVNDRWMVKRIIESAIR